MKGSYNKSMGFWSKRLKTAKNNEVYLDYDINKEKYKKFEKIKKNYILFKVDDELIDKDKIDFAKEEIKKMNEKSKEKKKLRLIFKKNPLTIKLTEKITEELNKYLIKKTFEFNIGDKLGFSISSNGIIKKFMENGQSDKFEIKKNYIISHIDGIETGRLKYALGIVNDESDTKEKKEENIVQNKLIEKRKELKEKKEDKLPLTFLTTNIDDIPETTELYKYGVRKCYKIIKINKDNVIFELDVKKNCEVKTGGGKNLKKGTKKKTLSSKSSTKTHKLKKKKIIKQKTKNNRKKNNNKKTKKKKKNIRHILKEIYG